jgi:glutathione S-transferase
VVCDSLAICEYLHERNPRAGGWPDASDARAIARSVSAEIHAGFPDLRANLPMNCRARVSRFTLSCGVKRDVERVAAIWRDWRQRFGDDGPWLFGKFSIADAMRGHPAVNEWQQASKAEPQVIAHAESFLDAGSV